MVRKAIGARRIVHVLASNVLIGIEELKLIKFCRCVLKLRLEGIVTLNP
jgi:hypothetical protein